MTIDDAYRFIQFCSNKKQNGVLDPDQFNLLAPICQISVINQLLGNEQEYRPGSPVPRYGIGLNQKIMEDIKHLITPQTTTAFTSGVAPYPADGLYIYDIGLPGTGVIATPVEIDELRRLKVSQIKPPTLQYPVYCVLGDNITISPNTIASAEISYVRTPATPKWNYNITNGAPVFNNTGSQNFEIGPLLHLRVCLKIIQALGINLSQSDLNAFGMAWEAQGA